LFSGLAVLRPVHVIFVPAIHSDSALDDYPAAYHQRRLFKKQSLFLAANHSLTRKEK